MTSVEDAEKLALAFHRVSRAVRLTLALESKLAREDHERPEPNEGDRVDRADARQATCARKDQVRAVVSRDIWNETDGEAAESLIEALDERLEEDAGFAQFLDGPVEVAIARIRKDLGLPANDAGPPGAAPETFPSDADPWRSSAWTAFHRTGVHIAEKRSRLPLQAREAPWTGKPSSSPPTDGSAAGTSGSDSS